MKIRLESEAQMRYDTLGDWYYEGDTLIIKVAEGLDPEVQFLIALHELIESKLCAVRGISQLDVDLFDFSDGAKIGEPGDHPKAPYRKEHRFAMLIEHLMAHEMGLLGYGEIK